MDNNKKGQCNCNIKVISLDKEAIKFIANSSMTKHTCDFFTAFGADCSLLSHALTYTSVSALFHCVSGIHLALAPDFSTFLALIFRYMNNFDSDSNKS